MGCDGLPILQFDISKEPFVTADQTGGHKRGLKLHIMALYPEKRKEKEAKCQIQLPQCSS
jgi:hypothetical protein